MDETARFYKALNEIQKGHVIRFYPHGAKVEVEDHIEANGLLFCLICTDKIRGRTVCCPKKECETSGAWLLTPKNKSETSESETGGLGTDGPGTGGPAAVVD